MMKQLHCNDSKHRKQKKYGPSFACRGRRPWDPVAIQLKVQVGDYLGRDHCGPCVSVTKKRFLILLVPFRVILVLNPFEGL